MYKDDCVFCQIAQKKSKADIAYEDDSIVVFSSINPAADVHYLITPKSHVETFMDLSDEVFLRMKAVAQKIITEKDLKKAYKLIFNGGRFQAIGHVHWHLLAGKFKEGIQT